MHRRALSILPIALALGALAVASTQTAAFADPDLSGRGKPGTVAAGASTQTGAFANPDLSGRGKPGQVAADQAFSSKLPPSADSLTPPLAGYKLVQSALLTVPAGTETFGSVSCPSGRATGGGAIASSTGLGVNLNSSFPSSDGSAWNVYIHNQTGANDTFSVYAVCAKRIKAYTVVIGSGVNATPGVQTTSITAQCPVGSFPYGGGGFNSSGDLPVLLNTSIPLAKGWRVDVNNGGSGSDTATAYAVCGKKATGYAQVVGSGVSNPANSQTAAVATCPSGTNVFGGGDFSSSGSTAVNLNSTAFSSSTGWISWQNNATAGSTFLTPYAVCAAVV